MESPITILPLPAWRKAALFLAWGLSIALGLLIVALMGTLESRFASEVRPIIGGDIRIRSASLFNEDEKARIKKIVTENGGSLSERISFLTPVTAWSGNIASRVYFVDDNYFPGKLNYPLASIQASEAFGTASLNIGWKAFPSVKGIVQEERERNFSFPEEGRNLYLPIKDLPQDLVGFGSRKEHAFLITAESKNIGAIIEGLHTIGKWRIDTKESQGWTVGTLFESGVFASLLFPLIFLLLAYFSLLLFLEQERDRLSGVFRFLERLGVSGGDLALKHFGIYAPACMVLGIVWVASAILIKNLIPSASGTEMGLFIFLPLLYIPFQITLVSVIPKWQDYTFLLLLWTLCLLLVPLTPNIFFAIIPGAVLLVFISLVKAFEIISRFFLKIFQPKPVDRLASGIVFSPRSHLAPLFVLTLFVGTLAWVATFVWFEVMRTLDSIRSWNTQWYVIGLTSEDIPRFQKELSLPDTSLFPIWRGRITSINGVGINAHLGNRADEGEFRREMQVTDQKQNDRVVGWKLTNRDGISVDSEFALSLGVTLWDRIDFTFWGIEKSFVVEELRETDRATGAPFFYFIAQKGALSDTGKPQYFAALDNATVDRAKNVIASVAPGRGFVIDIREIRDRFSSIAEEILRAFSLLMAVWCFVLLSVVPSFRIRYRIALQSLLKISKRFGATKDVLARIASRGSLLVVMPVALAGTALTLLSISALTWEFPIFFRFFGIWTIFSVATTLVIGLLLLASVSWHSKKS